MAITYFGSAAQPADGAAAANAGPGPRDVTPPASMVAGDLVLLIAQYRGAVTLTVSVDEPVVVPPVPEEAEAGAN